MKKNHRLLAALAALAVPLVSMAPAADWYVATNGAGNGTSWADATNSLQGAIVASTAGDTVWVSNGVYETGGIKGYPTGTSLTNRVAIYKAITVRSANNDPTNTIIKGSGPNGAAAVRCVFMTNGSTLIGFTLTNGATMATGTDDKYGGGIWSQSTNTVISNCVLIGNSANWVGGGVYYGTLYNCTLISNLSTFGGGACYGTLFNCTLVSNVATVSGGGGGGTYGGILSNCTLSRNSTVNYGGGTYNSTLYNCTLISNSAVNYGGGAYYGTLFNCMLASNSASSGGGAYYGILTNSTLTGNSAAYGGGAYNSTLYNCTLISNSATYGGGVYSGTLYNCTLNRNSSGAWGGGARDATLYNCTLNSNSASDGGAAFNSTLFNCRMIGNSCSGLGSGGGGAWGSVLYNCTLSGNSSGSTGGGVSYGTMYNCISWGNNLVDLAGTWSYSCAAGISGAGTITNNPLFITNGSGYGSGHVAGNYRLRKESPPLNAGTNFSWMTDPADARSKDLDDLRRIDNFSRQVDMGCYELMPSGTMITFH